MFNKTEKKVLENILEVISASGIGNVNAYGDYSIVTSPFIRICDLERKVSALFDYLNLEYEQLPAVGERYMVKKKGKK